MRHAIGGGVRRATMSLVVAASSMLVTAPALTASPGPETSPAPVVSAGSAVSVGPAGPLAAEMADLLETRPGGVQVSDHAVAWAGDGDGDGSVAVVVWPGPGESRAPAGLGRNVREDVVAELGLERLAEQPDISPAGVYTSCPSGYYCFYTSTNYDGVRYQFSGTCSGYASDWGFNNQTSSWVNRTGSNKIIYAYDYSGGPLLWHEPHPSRSSNVGSADDNRMSYWRCSHT